LSCDELRFTVACDAEMPFTRSTNAVQVITDRIRSRSRTPGPPRWLPPGNTALGSKVALLSQPRAYPEPTRIVEPVETTLSWVFLTEQRAYKLKKPARNEFVDLRTLEARRQNCVEELRVNGRFGDDVYLDLVPLTQSSTDALHLAGPGETVDWLLRMRRLPADRMLDRVIASKRFESTALIGVVELLCRVYARSQVALSETAYIERLVRLTRDNEQKLCRPGFGLPPDLVKPLIARQLEFLERSDCFNARVRASRIVEGHGDLRPEHICLEAAPRIIDSLEFSRELRTLDAVDELGFLALECERLGAPQARDFIFDVYRHITGDAAPDALIHFYQSLRACVRASLAIRHVLDPDARDPHRWPQQAMLYLSLALAHGEQWH
jgi:aminoglycoside phosphotransferase family enzyme